MLTSHNDVGTFLSCTTMSATNTNGKPPSSPTTADLPPARRSKMLKPVSPPLASTRLYRFIYILLFLTTLLSAFYAYRTVQYKKEVGGWWNLALGKRPPQFQTERKPAYKGEESVEERINALAKALGMPSKDLAIAIASAVREYVPPASLSSVAAKETGPVVEALVKGRAGDHSEESAEAAESTGVAGRVFSGIENFVGMDQV